MPNFETISMLCKTRPVDLNCLASTYFPLPFSPFIFVLFDEIVRALRGYSYGGRGFQTTDDGHDHRQGAIAA